jgi:hypothetical protein
MLNLDNQLGTLNVYYSMYTVQTDPENLHQIVTPGQIRSFGTQVILETYHEINVIDAGCISEHNTCQDSTTTVCLY